MRIIGLVDRPIDIFNVSETFLGTYDDYCVLQFDTFDDIDYILPFASGRFPNLIFELQWEKRIKPFNGQIDVLRVVKGDLITDINLSEFRGRLFEINNKIITSVTVRFKHTILQNINSITTKDENIGNTVKRRFSEKAWI